MLYRNANFCSLCLLHDQNTANPFARYRLSKKNDNLEIARPAINLRSYSKIHFKKRKRRKHEKYLKSQLVRGVKLWEMLPEKLQKATTYVKFKSLVKQICKT